MSLGLPTLLLALAAAGSPTPPAAAGPAALPSPPSRDGGRRCGPRAAPSTVDGRIVAIEARPARIGAPELVVHLRTASGPVWALLGPEDRPELGDVLLQLGDRVTVTGRPAGGAAVRTLVATRLRRGALDLDLSRPPRAAGGEPAACGG